MLAIRLFGGFEARSGRDGAAVRVAPGKAQALLAYLAMRPGLAHPRDKLAVLLWGEAPAARARHSLRQALVGLRRALSRAAPACLVEDGDAIALAEAAVDVDIARFEALLEAGTPDALARAVDLYGGDLLEGLTAGEPPLEEWLIGERERLRELVLEALAKLLAHHTEAGRRETAVRFAVRLLALEPTQESIHRALMRLYERIGRRGAALRQYQACVAALARELGEEPEGETRQLYHQILQRTASAPPGAAQLDPAPASLGAGTALVGREAEQAVLERLVVQTAGGRGGALAVLGEAGVGKTRLAEELASRATGAGFRVLGGRAYEMERGLPFGPWVEVLRAGLAVAERGELAELPSVWRAHLQRILPEMTPAESDRARPANGSLGLFEAVARLLALLAVRSPLAVTIEDVHAADDMSLRLLAFLGRRIAGVRILLVVTARDEDLSGAAGQALSSLDREGRLVRLPLDRLDEAGTRALVAALARPGMSGEDAARLARRVWALSEGNPFMIAEAVRVDGREPASEEVLLPERVRDLVLGRVDRLGRRARSLLDVAAVLGRQIDFALLRRAAGLGSAEAAAGIEELVRRRILRAVGERFEFTHDSIRRAVYERLITPVRASLHLAVARILERRQADGDDTPAQALLAHHYARTGAAAKAIRYLVACAETASRRYAVEDAIGLLEDALARVPDLPTRGRDRARIDVTLRLAVALALVGRFAEILDRLRPLAERIAKADARVAGIYHARVALTASILGRHDLAVGHARLALDAGVRAEDDTALGQAHYVLAVSGFVRGHPRSGVEHAREAVARFDRTGDRLWVAHSEWIMGLCHWLAGDLGAGLAAEERVEEIGRALEDPGLAAQGAWSSGLILAMGGDSPRACEAARRSREHALDPANRAAAEAVMGHALLVMGDAAEAATALAGGIAELGAFQIRCAVLYPLLGEARRRLGEMDAAMAAAEQGLALSRAAGFAWAAAAAHRELGQILLAAGRSSEAGPHLTEAFAGFEAAGSPLDAERTRRLIDDGSRSGS